MEHTAFTDDRPQVKGLLAPAQPWRFGRWQHVQSSSKGGALRATLPSSHFETSTVAINHEAKCATPGGSERGRVGENTAHGARAERAGAHLPHGCVKTGRG